MSKSYAKMSSAIIGYFFGPWVEKVADCLLRVISRTLLQIIKDTSLDKESVQRALGVLIKYNLVTFETSETNAKIIEYSIQRDDCLWLLHLPRCLNIIRSKYGTPSETILEILLKYGSSSISKILFKCMRSDAHKRAKLEVYRNAILTLINEDYLERLPIVMNRRLVRKRRYIPIFKPNLQQTFNPAEINLRYISQVLDKKARLRKASDADKLWKVNFARFYQDVRDQIMIGAIERKLGKSAGECFQFILRERSIHTDREPKDVSRPFTYNSLKSMVEKESTNGELIRHLSQYVKIIVDDSIGFLRRIGESGNGEYVVDFGRVFSELSLICIEKIITERFGSKAARIFRVIRTKSFLDQEVLQREALMSAKEAKAISYELLTAQFIQVQTIRKSGGVGQGVANKGFHLFCVRHALVLKMVLGNCYKTVSNLFERSVFEFESNRTLMEKGEKIVECIEELRQLGEQEEYINEVEEMMTPLEQRLLKKAENELELLSLVNLSVVDTIFLLRMYFRHMVAPSVSLEPLRS